jgi:hypothetical protein
LNFNIGLSTNKRNEQNQSVQANTNVNNAQQPAQNNNQPEQQQGGIVNLIKNAAHPGICILTIAFKIAAIVSFILLDVFLSSEAVAYLVVIITGAFDFWITKNVSGRLLVGLRWWNEIKEDGTEVWVFESKNESIFLFKF